MHFYFIFILWSHNHSVAILKTKTQNRYIFRLLKIIKSPYTPNGTNPWRTWLNCRNKCAPPLQFVSWRAKQSLIYSFIGHPRVAILVSYSLCCYLVVCRGRDSNWNEQGAAKNPFTRVDKGTHQHNPNMHSKSFFRARDFTQGPRKTLRWVIRMLPSGLCRAQMHFVYEFYLEKFSKSWCVSSQSWTQSKRSFPLFSGALWRATLDAQTINEDEIWRNWKAKTRGCILEKKGWELFSIFGSCGTKDDAGRQSCQKLIGEGSWPKITHAKYFIINVKWKTSLVTSRAMCTDLFDR